MTAPEARYATLRTPERETIGPRLTRLSMALGQPLTVYQQYIADVAGELLTADECEAQAKPLGSLAYPEAWFLLGRQNGKTLLALVFELDAAINSPRAEDVLYTAQDQQKAAEKLLVDQYERLIKPSALDVLIDRPHRTPGDQKLLFANGSRIVTLPSTQHGGRGRTAVRLTVLDEAYADTSMDRYGAVSPSMLVRDDAQILGCSNMGTETSVLLNNRVERGREFVRSGRNTSMAYFEWSADPDADIADPKVWRQAIPALAAGLISESKIRDAFENRPSDEVFMREYLNIQTSADTRVIPLEVWEAVCGNHEADMRSQVTIAVDCNPERTWTAIAVCDPNGVAEIINYKPGVTWAVERCSELAAKYRVPINGDPNSPAGTVLHELAQRGVATHALTGSDMANACGHFLDAVNERKVRIRQDHALDAAVAAAVKRIKLDVWTWARRSTAVDISPLVAVTECVWLATSAKPHIPLRIL